MGHGTRDMGQGAQDMGHGTRGMGQGTWDMGQETLGMGHGTWDKGHGTRDMGRPRPCIPLGSLSRVDRKTGLCLQALQSVPCCEI